MAFNTLAFLLFFVVVFTLYWFPLKGRTKAQNVLLLLSSWFFYGYASMKMLPGLILVTVAYYGLGLGMRAAKSERGAAALKTLGVLLGVGMLLWFKYLNFFIESFATAFHTSVYTFKLIMPVGLSFITFRLMSYVMEIHRGRVEPTKDFVSFATYVAFFPCVLSGPIDRPTFIGQLQKERDFDYDQAAEGVRQFLWGLAKKVLIADRCVYLIDPVWDNIASANGSTLLMVAILYSFQMYTDFSGYSDMAIGVGKLMGFRIAKNFNYPFFATNVAEYWRRWHMSLTSWLTDYVFMPLNVAFRNIGKVGMCFAIIINMVVVGLWHGANWTYGAFGLYHGLLFVPLVLSGAFMKKHKLKTVRFDLPSLKDAAKMLLTFALVTIGLIIFRAENVAQAWQFICGMMHLETFKGLWMLFLDHDFVTRSGLIVILLILEWRNRKLEFPLVALKNHHWAVRWGVYVTLVCMLVMLWGKNLTFLYVDF